MSPEYDDIKEQAVSVSGPAKKKKREPRKISMTYLQNAALYHLQRYASSSENLRRVLVRKVLRSAHHHETDEQEGITWVDEIVERYLQSGLLDDNAYAETKVRALRARGNSNRMVMAKLSAKGVPTQVIQGALTSTGEQDGNEETEAAIQFARRRRFGPFAEPGKRDAKREKSLAAMARAGFRYDLAQRIIDAETPEDVLANMRYEEI